MQLLSTPVRTVSLGTLSLYVKGWVPWDHYGGEFMCGHSSYSLSWTYPFNRPIKGQDMNETILNPPDHIWHCVMYQYHPAGYSLNSWPTKSLGIIRCYCFKPVGVGTLPYAAEDNRMDLLLFYRSLVMFSCFPSLSLSMDNFLRLVF